MLVDRERELDELNSVLNAPAARLLDVTHHAQIASLARAHYFVGKTFDSNRTLAHVKKLDGKEREIEISRLLSGDNSENTAKLAREMIEKGNELRNAQKKT